MSAQVEDKKANAIDEGIGSSPKSEADSERSGESLYLEYYLTHSKVFRRRK
jgi:predicted RecA/RadA family phage recombinase